MLPSTAPSRPSTRPAVRPFSPLLPELPLQHLDFLLSSLCILPLAHHSVSVYVPGRWHHDCWEPASSVPATFDPFHPGGYGLLAGPVPVHRFLVRLHRRLVDSRLYNHEVPCLHRRRSCRGGRRCGFFHGRRGWRRRGGCPGAGPSSSPQLGPASARAVRSPSFAALMAAAISLGPPNSFRRQSVPARSSWSILTLGAVWPPTPHRSGRPGSPRRQSCCPPLRLRGRPPAPRSSPLRVYDLKVSPDAGRSLLAQGSWT